MFQMRLLPLLIVYALAVLGTACGDSKTGRSEPVVRQIDDRLICDYGEAEQMAHVQLLNYRNDVQYSINNGSWRDFGFSDISEYDRAVIGQGERIYVIDPWDLQESAGRDSVLSLVRSQSSWDLTHSCVWVFPVTVDNEIRADMRVSYKHYAYYEKPEWFGMLTGTDAVYYPGGTTARRIDEAEKIIDAFGEGKGLGKPVLYAVEIRDLAASLLIAAFDREERVVFMTPGGFGPLSADTAYQPNEVLPTLAAEALKIVGAGFPQTEEEARHSAGLCDWRVAGDAVAAEFDFYLGVVSNDSRATEYYFGSQDNLARAYPGEGVREYNLLTWGYKPGVQALSLLYEPACYWHFSAMVDGTPCMDLQVAFDTDGTPSVVGAGGNANMLVAEVKAEMPDFLRSLGGTTYNLYYVRDKLLRIPYIVVNTDKGEFISFGPPPLDFRLWPFIPKGRGEEWFYPSEEILPIFKAEWDNSMGLYGSIHLMTTSSWCIRIRKECNTNDYKMENFKR